MIRLNRLHPMLLVFIFSAFSAIAAYLTDSYLATVVVASFGVPAIRRSAVIRSKRK